MLPDLTILGKIVGGGLPLAAFGGQAEVMDRLAPAGDVYQAGTLSGNPLATAAGVSVLRRLRDDAVYERLEELGARLEAGLAGFGAVQRVGAMATLFCRDDPVRSFADAERADTERYGGLFEACSSAGSISRPRSSSACSSPPRTRRTTSTARSRPLATSSATDLWHELAAGAAAEARCGRCLRPAGEREHAPSSPRSPSPGTRSASRRSTRATSSTTAARGCSRPPTAIRRSCSATTSTPTASFASPRAGTWRPSPTSRS